MESLYRKNNFRVFKNTPCFLVVGLVELPFLSDISLCFDSMEPGVEPIVGAYPNRSSQ